MSGFLSKTLCLGIGAALGAGITYLAMKDESEDVSDTPDEFSDASNEDHLMDEDGEMNESLNAVADENLAIT